jgi:DNA-binding transcriptional LysR family regulator
MDIRQLRYFLALAEHRSFNRAAEAIGITQPAFSRAIQHLEQELGCQLIDRASKDLRPTAEGQVVLQHALSLVRGISNLSQAITQMTKLDGGQLQFGCSPAFTGLLAEAVGQFMARHPRVRTGVRIGDGESLSRGLNRDEIEFFLADIRQFEADPSVQTRALAPRQGLFYCRPGHPLLAKESLSTNDLFDYPLVAPQLPTGVRKVLANLSGKADFELQLECEQLSVLEQVVRHSDAIGIATEDTLREALDRGELLQLHPRNMPPRLESFQTRCGIVTRTGYRLSPAASAMIELLQTLDQQARAAA